MHPFRKALLISIAAILILPLFGSLSYATPIIPIPDVEQDEVFYPHIRRLFENYFIKGDDGSGQFRPDDPINRAEFTKITAYTRLAEKYGLPEDWDSKGRMGMSETVSSKLKYYYQCDHSEILQCSSVFGADVRNICNVCESIGNEPFSDVAEKKFFCEERTGFKEPCSPWYGQYVYYAVRKGFIKGYPESGERLFKPGEDILRLHALKMIIVDDGNIPPESDTRYRRLEQKAEDNSSYRPKCLSGAENYILYNNGGSTADSRKILDYALLADRLDLFGNDCSVFGSAKTPLQRAAFLQQPMTRKEAPRYFALTMEYDPVEPNPATDTTINTTLENEISEASDSTYEIPEYVETEVLTALGLPSDTEEPEEPSGEDSSEEEPDDTVPDEEEAEEPVEGPIYGPIEDPSRNNCEYINYEYEIVSKWPNGIVSPGSEIALRIAPTANSTWHTNVSCNKLKLVRLDAGGSPTDTEAEFRQEIKNGVATWKTSFASINQLDKTQDSEQQAFVIMPNYENANWVSDKIYWIVGKKIDYWYTVISGWHTVNDGLWGGVFKERRYTKDNSNLIEILFPVKSDNKYKELVVQVISESEDYDNTDPNAAANKKAMIKNYRTTRWYKILYTNPADPEPRTEKIGWVPVSGTVKKDDIFYMIKDGYYIFSYYSLSRYNDGYSNSDTSKINKLLLHNTAGFQIAFWITGGHPTPPTYFLAAEHREDKAFSNKFVSYLPEYRSGGSVGNRNGYSGKEIENQSISVEMANVEWANPSLKTKHNKDREVINGIFHDFDFEKLKGDYNENDLDKVNHYTVISREKYDLVNYFFSEKDGFFEVFNIDNSKLPQAGKDLKKEIRDDKDEFYKYYDKKEKRNKETDEFLYYYYGLKQEYKDIINSGSDSEEKLNNLYKVLNKIPFEYKFLKDGGGEVVFSLVADNRGTYPLKTWNLSGHRKEQNMDGDSKSSDYFQRYTKGQYKNMNEFIKHMNEKYGISKKTFEHDLPDGIKDKYGFYFQKNNIDGSNGDFIKKVKAFEGTISHHNQTYTGKMCPAPGFQIDRISEFNQ